MSKDLQQLVGNGEKKKLELCTHLKEILGNGLRGANSFPLLYIVSLKNRCLLLGPAFVHIDSEGMVGKTSDSAGGLNHVSNHSLDDS